MENLTVTPEYLERLARILDTAAEQAERAAAETKGIPTEVEKTWGSLFRTVNDSFVHVGHTRHYAVTGLKAACINLAEIARSAADAYANCDALAAENLNKQMLDY